MKNIMKLLKGKSYEEGLKIIKDELGESPVENRTNIDDGLFDSYEYMEDNENWVCFTCPAEKVPYDEPIVNLDKGYWNVCVDGYTDN